MKLTFKGDIQGLEKGIEILSGDLGYEVGASGIIIEVQKGSKNIEVSYQGGKGLISFDKKIHFFRALGLFVEALGRNDQFKIVEEPQFTMNGAMFDASRNAVLKVESIKIFLRKMAVMGLNMLMMYTEDTYTIEGKPYFGYMRGRYSYEELKECDDYADIFGIEMMPCIQALGHLAQALKWNFGGDIRDTGDILLVGSEDTYKFVEEMIRAASAPFRSKRIHIGMDEAYSLGLGSYLRKNGYKNSLEIMNQHLARVVEITEKLGLKPMMWGDMFIALASKNNNVYDPNSEIPEEIIKSIPADMQVVYWDYYHGDEKTYYDMIHKYRSMKKEPVFAGGIWTWVGPTINYGITFVTTNAALNTCKKEGVKEVFATLWGDNGAETNLFSSLLGLQLFAEHGYSKDLDMEKLKSRFKFCTGGDYDAFRALSKLDERPDSNGEYKGLYNPSKYLLWQDVLTGLFDRHAEGYDLNAYYKTLEKELKGYKESNKEWDFVFGFPEKLCNVLSVKAQMGIRLKEAYDNKNIDALKFMALKELPDLIERVKDLKNVSREQWLKTNKPFGWDVVDIRYGGLLARLDTAVKRLSDYIDGKIDYIEELEQERLYFDGREQAGDTSYTLCNQYDRIATACPL